MTGPQEPIHNGSLTPGHIYLYMEYLLYLYADHYPMMYGRSYTYIQGMYNMLQYRYTEQQYYSIENILTKVRVVHVSVH